MSKIYQTIILAGLLHDIGKFLQRSDFQGSLKVKGKHPAVSASFIKAKSAVFAQVSDVSLLAELVQRHHASRSFPPELRVQQADPLNRPLAYLVSTADNYSAAERGDAADEYRDYKTTPLASVFSGLKLTRNTPPANHYQLHPLNPANAFPEPLQALNTKKTNDYLHAFGVEFDRVMAAINLADFDCLYTHLLSLLQRFTWCVPSNTQEQVPDISLYDHLRTTSAIAACLYRYHEEMHSLNEKAVADQRPDKFRLVVGDLSGIQNYIFDIANIGVGGVAKRLRSRSFYLSALAEAISHRLIHDFHLPLTNIVMSSGGKFYVLLPNLPESGDKIKAFQQDLDQWAVSHFGGELVVNLAQLAFNGQAFEHFGQVLGAISDRLSQRKGNPLNNYLVHDGEWKTEHFKVPAPKGEAGLCQSCQKQIAVAVDEHGDKLCLQCRRDQNLGRILPNATGIAFVNRDLPPHYRHAAFPLYEDYQFVILEDKPRADLPAYLVYQLNGDSQENIPHHPVLAKFMANYIPLAEEDNCAGCAGCQDEYKPTAGSPIYFDCMANKAHGRKLLGYLKADVDNLGNLFVYGLRDDPADRNSISRTATMSRMLDLFFSGRVEQLLNNRFQYCYTVFSGGDDLLIVGPWDEIVALAVTLREEFKRFTNQNDNVTMSAGISLLKPGIPVSRSVAVADDALEDAKETIIKGETEGRDQLTLLGATMKWSKVAGLLTAAGQLSGWLKKRAIKHWFFKKTADVCGYAPSLLL